MEKEVSPKAIAEFFNISRFSVLYVYKRYRRWHDDAG